ncbi:MAG: peptide ABC transporter substrate-binding protein [Gemmatimonadota bacterium]|nr:peptide ABC transporter substrate-binding protein [Gemmatimonadota bacterium]
MRRSLLPSVFCLLTGLIVVFVQYPSARPQMVNSLGKVFPADAAPMARQVYHFMADEPTSLDVSANLYVGEWNEFLFEQLVARDENQNIIPAAADHWEMAADGMTWTFYLRKTGKWSDGRPVTAHDFVYTYRRSLSFEIANPYAAFYYDIKGAKPYNQTPGVDPALLGVRALNDYTLVIETEHPTPYLGLILSAPTSMPVPRWQVEKYGKKWTEAGNCVSNSSYQLSEWQHGSHMDFTLNTYYDGPLKGYVEEIHRTFRHPSGANLLPYENNEVGRAAVQANELRRVLNDPVLSKELDSNLADGTWYVFFGTRKPPFNDPRVRQAVSRAINREAICRAILGGAAVPAYSMLPRTFEAYDDYNAYQDYNPVEAKRLMAKAGYPNGRGFPTVEMWLRQASPETKLAAEAIQAMLLEHLGMRITFRSADYPVFTDAMFKWTIQLGLVPFFADFRDPKNMLDMIWRPGESGRARHDFNNPEFSRLLDAADNEPEVTKRNDIYRQAERILVTEIGAAFVYHPIQNTLFKPWIKGLKTNKFGGKTFVVTDLYIGNEILDN